MLNDTFCTREEKFSWSLRWNYLRLGEKTLGVPVVALDTGSDTPNY